MRTWLWRLFHPAEAIAADLHKEIEARAVTIDGKRYVAWDRQRMIDLIFTPRR